MEGSQKMRRNPRTTGGQEAWFVSPIYKNSKRDRNPLSATEKEKKNCFCSILVIACQNFFGNWFWSQIKNKFSLASFAFVPYLRFLFRTNCTNSQPIIYFIQQLPLWLPIKESNHHCQHMNLKKKLLKRFSIFLTWTRYGVRCFQYWSVNIVIIHCLIVWIFLWKITFWEKEEEKVISSISYDTIRLKTSATSN